MHPSFTHCPCRGALSARAPQAGLTETLILGTMMSAAFSGFVWLMLRLAI